MNDPRLNSLHLDPTRREEFRRAREELLRARGSHTLLSEDKQAEDAAPDLTCIHNPSDRAPAHLDCWLSDRDYIYPLKVGLNTMGRSADNDIVVEDLYVSRRHCSILMHHDLTCVLHDTASKNGVYLNGTRIPGPTPLRPGDEVRICNRQFVFLTRAASPEASPAPSAATRTIAG